MYVSWDQGLATPESWWLARLPESVRTKVIELLWDPQGAYFGIPYGKLGLIPIRTVTSPTPQNAGRQKIERRSGRKSKRVETPTSGKSSRRSGLISFSFSVGQPSALSWAIHGSLQIEVPPSMCVGQLRWRRSILHTSFVRLTMEVRTEQTLRSSLALSEVRAQVRNQRLESR